MSKHTVILAALLCAGLMLGCNKPSKPQAGTKVNPSAPPQLKAAPGQPGAKVAPEQPGAKAAPKMPVKMPTKMPMVPPKMAKRPLFAGAHILISYKGASKAKATRSKAEALKLAKKLVAQAKKAPGTFTEMAKKHSEGPSGKTGGFLRIWPKGSMVPAFDTAIEKLKYEQVSPPVETPYGYHVIKRLQIFSGANILVQFKGVQRAAPAMTRSKADAQKRAKDLLMKLRKDPKLFLKMVKESSDGPNKIKGGELGVWWKGAPTPKFFQEVEKLEVGKFSEVVESPFGLHILLRKKAPETT